MWAQSPRAPLSASAWVCSLGSSSSLILAAFAGLTPFLHKDSAGGCVDAVAGGPVHFECETAEAHMHVRWFKDGAELSRSCSHFSQEDVGTRHRLVATSVTRQDEGTYSCRVGEHSVAFRLRVCGRHAPPELGGWEAGPVASGTCQAALPGPPFLQQMLGAGQLLRFVRRKYPQN